MLWFFPLPFLCLFCPQHETWALGNIFPVQARKTPCGAFMVIHLQASRAVHRLQLQGRQLVPACGYSQALLVLQVQEQPTIKLSLSIHGLETMIPWSFHEQYFGGLAGLRAKLSLACGAWWDLLPFAAEIWCSVLKLGSSDLWPIKIFFFLYVSLVL